MPLPSTRLGVGLLVLLGLAISTLALGAAWEIESVFVFFVATLLLAATACGAVALVLRVWPPAPEAREPGVFEYVEALGILLGFFGLWAMVAQDFGPEEDDRWESLPVPVAPSPSLDTHGERVAESNAADGQLRLELRLPGRRFRHQGAVPFEVRLCSSAPEPTSVPGHEDEEKGLQFSVGATEGASWKQLQESTPGEATLPQLASGECLVHRDELLSNTEPPAPGTHRLTVRWAGLVADLELEVEARVIDQAWLLAPDVIAWQDDDSEVHTLFDPSSGALAGGPVMSARPRPSRGRPVTRWLLGGRDANRWLVEPTILDNAELRTWSTVGVGSQEHMWWVDDSERPAAGGRILRAPLHVEPDEGVVFVGYVGARFALGRPVEGHIEWTEGPSLEPERGYALLWADGGTVADAETQLLAVGEAPDAAQILFGFSVPHASGALPTYSGERRRYPPGSTWASDRALWLTFSHEGRQVLTRIDPNGESEPRWDLGVALPGHLRGTRLGSEEVQALFEDDQQRWVLLSDSAPPCPLPDDPLLAVFLDDGRLLAAHADGLRVHALACPSPVELTRGSATR